MTKINKSAEEKIIKKRPIKEKSLSELKKTLIMKKAIEEEIFGVPNKRAERNKAVEEKKSSQEMQQKPKRTDENRELCVENRTRYQRESKRSKTEPTDIEEKEKQNSHKKKNEKRDASPKPREHKESNRKNVQPREHSPIAEASTSKTKRTRSETQRDVSNRNVLPIPEIVSMYEMTQRNLEAEAKRLKEAKKT